MPRPGVPCGWRCRGFVYCLGVPAGRTKLEGILEQELTRSLEQPVEILNFGISAIDTWNQLQIFQLKAARYRPDLTLLAFFRDNIERLQPGKPNPLLDVPSGP